MTIHLKEVMKDIASDIPNLDITGITYDSRRVQPGYLFAALTGLEHDGHQFIPQAIENGAVAILGSQEITGLSVPYVRVPETRAALADVAARFYQDPTLGLPVIGITGTNGKTTCSYLIESILRAAGYEPAVLGTISYRHHGKEIPAPYTTPEATDLQAWIAEAKEAGVNAVVMEISSHGIAMERVRHCHLDVAAFTNLSQDHLDFHDSMEAYFKTKAQLFSELLPASSKPRKHAIVNCEDEYGRELAKIIDTPLSRCGQDADLEFQLTAEELNINGIELKLQTPDGPLELASPLIGHFNVQNIMVSVAACHALGISLKAIQEGIANMRGVPGRVERISNKHGLHIFVDYAHTPDALRRVLEAVKPFVKGRLICVFGCGGDRDQAKRPLMGHAAGRLSDIIFITSDNPRTENPQTIIDQIIPGLRADRVPAYNIKTKRGYLIESDRRSAIQQAIQMARPDDIVMIAGKGHEDYQILGTEKIHFDDREEARAACEAL